jgi:hypothetical protein
LNLDLNYEFIERCSINSKWGVLLPGTYFTNYSHPDFGSGFDTPALGAELNAIVQF